MNIANNLEFLATEVIPYIGTQPQATQQYCVFPRIIHRIIDILGSGTQLVHYKELLAAFVPPVTNFVFSYDEGLCDPALRAQVAESLTGLKAGLRIVASDSPHMQGVWALASLCGRFTGINHSVHDHICADEPWNHKVNPTIFVNTTLDSLLARTDISEAERLHLFLQDFAVAIHELGHLLPRYIHHPTAKNTPETLHASTFSSKPVGRGEGGECVEEVAFGGKFDIDLRPHRPQGYRLVGHTRKSNMHTVIGADERVSQIISLLTSPLAINPPGPPLLHFPWFAHPHHVIALNGPRYRDICPEAPEGLGPQPATIGVDEGGSAGHTLPSYTSVQTPPNEAAPLVPLNERLASLHSPNEEIVRKHSRRINWT